MSAIFAAIGAKLLDLFFVDVVYPLALDIAQKRETNAQFKIASDVAYGEVNAAADSASRKLAARKLYELQKNT